MRSKIISCFLVVFCCLTVTSDIFTQVQRSYIIEGDTRTLDVKIAWVKGWRPYYECIILSKEKPRTYNAQEIDGYKTNWGNPFVSFEVEPGEWIFLELIEPGELELYKYIDKDFVAHYYAKRFDISSTAD